MRMSQIPDPTAEHAEIAEDHPLGFLCDLCGLCGAPGVLVGLRRSLASLRFLLILASAGLLWAQAEAPVKRPDPVKWSLRLEPASAAPGGKVLGRLQAAVEAGWHFYAPGSPKPTIAATIGLAASPAVARSSIPRLSPGCWAGRGATPPSTS